MKLTVRERRDGLQRIGGECGANSEAPGQPAGIRPEFALSLRPRRFGEADRGFHRTGLGISPYANTAAPLMLPAPLPAALRLPSGKWQGFVSAAGAVFHLLSVGLAFSATIAVCFGVGFCLLGQSGTANADPAAPHQGARAAVLMAGAAHPGEAAVDADTRLTVSGAPASSDPTAVPASPLRAEPIASAVVESTPTPPVTGRLAAEPVDPRSAALIARGDRFLRADDTISARRLYERAANADDGQAALRMGATFDQYFLSDRGLPIAVGDPAAALSWYGRAFGYDRAFGLGASQGDFR